MIGSRILMSADGLGEKVENALLWSVVWGFISAISLPIGAFIGIFRRPSQKLTAVMMAFGGGALLFALSIELFGTTIAHRDHFESESEYNKIIFVMAASAIGGGVVFSGLDHLLNNAGAFLRKISTLRSQQTRNFVQKMLSDKTVQGLQATPVFKNVSENGLKRLLPFVQKLSFSPEGGPIYQELSLESPVYFVVSGRVKLTYQNKRGKNLKFAEREIGKNQIFGHQAMSVGHTLLTTATPLTTTVCLRIAKSDLDEVLKVHKQQPKVQRTQSTDEATAAIESIADIKDDIPAASVFAAVSAEQLVAGTALEDMPAEQQDAMYESSFQVVAEEGEEIVCDMHAASSVFFILHGCVRLREDGSNRTLQAGQLFGHEVLDIIAGRRAPFKVRACAKTDTVLLRVPRSQLDKLRRKFHDLEENLADAGAWEPSDFTAAEKPHDDGDDDDDGKTEERESNPLKLLLASDSDSGTSLPALPPAVGRSSKSSKVQGRKRSLPLVRQLSQEFAGMFRAKDSIFAKYAPTNTKEASSPDSRAGGPLPVPPPGKNQVAPLKTVTQPLRMSSLAVPAMVAAPDVIPDAILDSEEVAAAVGEDVHKDKNTAIMIWVGILLDAIPESLVIGFIVTEGSRNPLVFVVGVFLSNFPEAIASAATMHKVGLPTWTILSLWSFTCVATGLGAGIGSAVIPESGLTGDFELFVKGMEGMAAGAMLTMIAQTMLPEACEKGGGVTGIGCLAGFLCALLVSLIPFQ